MIALEFVLSFHSRAPQSANTYRIQATFVDDDISIPQLHGVQLGNKPL